MAADTGSTYRGKPSWRRFIKRLARGEFSIEEQAKEPSADEPPLAYYDQVEKPRLSVSSLGDDLISRVMAKYEYNPAR